MNSNSCLLAVVAIVFSGIFIEDSHCSPKNPLVSRDACVCYYIYDPVCASDGKTYGNSCELNCVRRQQPYIFGICKGECPCCKPAYQNEPIYYDDVSPGWGWGTGWRYTNLKSYPRVTPSDGIYVRMEEAPAPIQSNMTSTNNLAKILEDDKEDMTPTAK